MSQKENHRNHPMNRPHGQQCLAKAIIVGGGIRSNVVSYPPENMGIHLLRRVRHDFNTHHMIFKYTDGQLTFGISLATSLAE